MKKKTKKAFGQTAVLAILIIVCLIIVSLIAENRIQQLQEPRINQTVLQYKPLVEKYAKEYHVANYVDVLLAMMMQESGGRGNDPMQSSESYCGEIGCINDPELSIKQGVAYFSETLAAANYDVELAIQSYNFGKGFIQYVKEKDGQYSQDIAIQFSQEMYQNAPDKTIYSCLREEAKQFDACYGDIYYVRSVMGYIDSLVQEQ